MSRNVALVLSSGGARGVAHIGVIEELIKSGYTITSIAGASMGALVGGMVAKGTLPEFTEWLLSFSKMNVIKFMDLTMGHGGLIKGEKLVKVLEEFIGDVKIEDLLIPYACVAADLIGHKEYVFDKGSLLLAIRASSSIPTVFLPVSLEGMMLVDGGVLNPLPLDVVKRTDGDILVAVNVNANIPYKPAAIKPPLEDQENFYSKIRDAINEKWSEVIDHYVEKHKNGNEPKPKPVNMFDVISDSVILGQNKIAGTYIEKYKPDVLVETSVNIASIFDFDKTEELIEAGRKACRKALDGLEKKLIVNR
jgi:NTE family protein